MDRPPLSADQILRRLVERGVDFVVIGGIAGVLHGSARNDIEELEAIKRLRHRR